jgi:Amino acid synthesis
MVDIRKIITIREAIFSELGVAAPNPVVRAVGMAVILNPFAKAVRRRSAAIVRGGGDAR